MTDGEILDCACGRKWQVHHRTPNFNSRGRVCCRCAAPLGQDDQGEWSAHLLSPREHFVPLRKLIAHIGVALLMAGHKLHIPIWRWIKIQTLAHLKAPNRALHARLETTSTGRRPGGEPGLI